MRFNTVLRTIFVGIALFSASSIYAADPPAASAILSPYTPPPYTLPPGFTSPGSSEPAIWDPTAGQCSAVYVPGMTNRLAYNIKGVKNPVLTDLNYFFYFPPTTVSPQGEVLTFIDPTIVRIYPKDVLDPDKGMAVNFKYPGGFPPGFEYFGKSVNVLVGNVTSVVRRN